MLVQRKRKKGDAVVVHGLRGRPSNRKLPAETQRRALAILKQPDWHDFGPTFAAEQLGIRGATAVWRNPRPRAADATGARLTGTGNWIHPGQNAASQKGASNAVFRQRRKTMI